MNLQKLFNMQAELDERIIQQHPELRGQNNLDWKLLALQVELGECANEWRGFKRWSNNQESRTSVKVGCPNCAGTGTPIGIPSYAGIDCWQCGGEGSYSKNPLLEEYIDCLHFILSIGLEIGYKEFDEEEMNEYFAQVSDDEKNGITRQFIAINYITSCMLENYIHYEQALYEILSLGEMLGFTWEQVEGAYLTKNKTNHERQLNGY
ncbi:dUTP diphosphatase [Metasolibacillus sp.]|uniref:dUTP diphosphatase n=1 Tax=Metasolibacillus sp. TaxID=2703680 RepID=UPI0025D78D4C|nr:dUTP diphosphatase [Metasolibacillus sp.]MCT6926341.1 dUTP diphosphatase [Metasolibacillus sp.]